MSDYSVITSNNKNIDTKPVQQRPEPSLNGGAVLTLYFKQLGNMHVLKNTVVHLIKYNFKYLFHYFNNCIEKCL